MKESNFLLGLRLYFIIINYCILIGYIYGYYKDYNIKESVLISFIIGILTPFFIPFHHLIYMLYPKIDTPVIYYITNHISKIRLVYDTPKRKIKPLRF